MPSEDRPFSEDRPTPMSSKSTPELTAEELLVQDTPPGSASGSGMGVAVSSMSAPIGDNENTLHGYSLSAEVTQLQKLLEQGVDVNQLDDYVSDYHSFLYIHGN